MDQEKIASFVKKIKTKTKLILKDLKNANLIIDLLACAQEENKLILCASCQALGTVFLHYVSAKPFLKGDKTAVSAEDANKEDQVSSWLKDQFTATCDVLCDFLSHESLEVRELPDMNKNANSLGNWGTNSPNNFPSPERSYSSIEGQMSTSALNIVWSFGLNRNVPVLNLSDGVRQAIMYSCAHVGIMYDYKNNKQHILQAHLNPITCSAVSQDKRWLVTGDVGPDAMVNIWDTYTGTPIQTMFDPNPKGGVVAVALTPDSRYLATLSALPIQIYGTVEAESTRISTPDGSKIKVIHREHDAAVHALAAHPKLDYPDFYAKLYSMFRPQIFSAKYRARFFHLADTFLSSTHLPSYLVAAFAKRLSRLSLHAPASAVHIAIPFIFNLIARHPSLEVMIGRTDLPSELTSDPYIPDEKEPASCKALDSCLWELQTLEHHYDPSISQKAQKRKVAEQDLSSILETTTSDIVSSYAKKIKKDTIPLNFVKINGLTLAGNFVL
uniref:CCAAT-binding factor domain-containing protein n=1 Tax=Biomphalaria glabrata TaxID=6526 RepID=A0A2C9LPD9_BIOGL